jgi:hypothetical protein
MAEEQMKKVAGVQQSLEHSLLVSRNYCLLVYLAKVFVRSARHVRAWKVQ